MGNYNNNIITYMCIYIRVTDVKSDVRTSMYMQTVITRRDERIHIVNYNGIPKYLSMCIC